MHDSDDDGYGAQENSVVNTSCLKVNLKGCSPLHHLLFLLFSSALPHTPSSSSSPPSSHPFFFLLHFLLLLSTRCRPMWVKIIGLLQKPDCTCTFFQDISRTF